MEKRARQLKLPEVKKVFVAHLARSGGKTNFEALLEAIELAGGIRALAREIGLSHEGVRRWERAPAEYIVDIEKATGVPRERLRPDIFEGMRRERERA